MPSGEIEGRRSDDCQEQQNYPPSRSRDTPPDQAPDSLQPQDREPTVPTTRKTINGLAPSPLSISSPSAETPRQLWRHQQQDTDQDCGGAGWHSAAAGQPVPAQRGLVASAWKCAGPAGNAHWMLLGSDGHSATPLL